MRTLVLDVETASSLPLDHPALVEMAAKAGKEPAAFAALSPVLARVLCVGMQELETGKQKCFFDYSLFTAPTATMPTEGAVACDGEKGLLEAVNAQLAKGTDRIVTFNGRSFDVPVLLNRMIARGVKPCDFLVRAFRQPRFKVGAHVDLLEQFTSAGAVRGGGMSLRCFALAHGLKDPKAGGDGAGVVELVTRGDAASLVGYCLGDVVTTATLFTRWCSLVGVAA